MLMCFPVKKAVFHFFQKCCSPNQTFENLKFSKLLSLFFTFVSTKTPLSLFSVCVGGTACAIRGMLIALPVKPRYKSVTDCSTK